MKLTVIIPAYNECQSIEKIVNKVIMRDVLAEGSFSMKLFRKFII